MYNLFLVLKKLFNELSTIQYEELIKYMESYFEFAANKYLIKEGKIHHAEQWNELHKMLNALWNGSFKTVEQWQTNYFNILFKTLYIYISK